MPETSIILRTKNEEKWLGKCLKRIFNQTYRNFEVIIIDSGSTDKTLEIAAKFDVRIMHIRPKQFSYPFALNYGCERASATKYFAILSGHSLPVSETWLEKGIGNFAQGNHVAGIYGDVWALPDASLWEKIVFCKLLTVVRHFPGKKLILRKHIRGILGFTNAMIRRDLWDRYHFNEEFGLGGEDGQWARYWLDKGYVIIKDMNFCVYHSHGLGFKQFIRQFETWDSLTEPQPFREMEYRHHK